MYLGTMIEAKIYRLQNQIEAKEEKEKAYFDKIIELTIQRDNLIDEKNSLLARIGRQNKEILLLRDGIPTPKPIQGSK